MIVGHEDVRRDIQRAWTEQLYKEYDNLCGYFRLQHLRAPIIRIEELTGTWGLWSSATRTLTINHKLIEAHPWDIVLEVLKHEMAHQLAYEHLGGGLPHGPAFQRACELLHVAEWARSASGELPEHIPSWRERTLSEGEERLLKRAEKLLALAASSNENEAALAMQRVRQLYAKYQLDRLEAKRQSNYVYCIISRKQKRISAEDTMIFSVLVRHFFVRAIYLDHYDAEALETFKAVELLGSRENILMAEYVYHFLDHKVKGLWSEYRARTGAPARARRSYMLGVLKGFSDKLEKSPPFAAEDAVSAQSQATSRSLMRVADGELKAFVEERYPRLHSRRGGGGYHDGASYDAGRSDGGSINLHRGVTARDGNRGALLGRG